MVMDAAHFSDRRVPGGERADCRRWREEGGERVAAVEKIEEKRKPEDFFGHRNRTEVRVLLPQPEKEKSSQTGWLFSFLSKSKRTRTDLNAARMSAARDG